MNDKSSKKPPVRRGEPLLFTPGPLTTSNTVKRAMLHDLGSRDPVFIELNRKVCADLLDLCQGGDAYSCVPLQGSGTFAVEAMLGSVVAPDGKILNLVNGAYGKRIASLCRYIGRECVDKAYAENQQVSSEDLDDYLSRDASITHVCLVYCETTTGILNPLEDIAEVVNRHGRRLLVDAMSAFGALPVELERTPVDALAASSNKCLQGVPGMGFVVVNSDTLKNCEGHAHSLALDLYAQAEGLAANGQWRFTPPVHCLLALARALEELQAEGGSRARLQRYRENCRILREGMRKLGFRPFLPEALQAPIILTFHSPKHRGFEFQRFYALLADRGFVIYPGKITDADTFRIGCIGDLGAMDMQALLQAVESVLREMNVEL